MPLPSAWRFWRTRRPEAIENLYSVSDPVLATMLGFGTYDGTSVIGEQTALTLSAVYRAVSLVAGAVAGLPLRVMHERDDGSRERVPSFLDYPGGRDGLTRFEWTELVMVHLLLHGNAFLQHIRNGAGAFAGLYPIHPSAVVVEEDNGRPGGRRFDVTTDDGRKVSFDARSMTHIAALSFDGLRGVSPLTVARLSLGTGISGDKAANRAFSNGAMVSGLVTPEEDLTEDEAKAIKAGLDDRITGPDKAGSLAVINRKLKFTQWTLSHQDAQFLESRAFQVEEIARWFGVPPHLLGQTDKQTSWGTGVAEQNRGLARYTLSPWTTRIEQRLTRVLPAGRFAEFDFAGFLQPAPEVEIPLLLAEVAGGLLTPNEARRMRNLPPVPGGDKPREAPAPSGTRVPDKKDAK